MSSSNFRKAVVDKLTFFDGKIKESFVMIKSDIDVLSDKVERMREYLKQKDKQFSDAWNHEEGLRKKFEAEVDDFSEKIAQLKLALSSVRSMKNELVVVRDLAKIEERIRTSFKNEIDGYKEQVRYLKEVIKDNEKRLKALEKQQVKKSSKKSFWKKRS